MESVESFNPKEGRPMSNSEPTDILLVHPPVASLSMPPWAPAQTAMYLAGSDVSFEQYDANLDFFLNHLLASKRLDTLVNIIKKREKQGAFETAEHDTASLAADLAADPEKWDRKIDTIDSHLELLRSDDFYRPERCLEALKTIDALLNLASLAFYPSRIQRHSFTNPVVTDWPAMEAFIEDQEANPFLHLCHSGLATRLERPELELLILFVSAPDQVPAAMTMAHFSKKLRPDLRVALMGNQSAVDAEQCGYALLPETDPKLLLNFVGELREPGSPENVAAPDFSTLPLKEYLTPALVLPLRMQAASGSDLIPPSLFFTLSENCRRNYKAEGFFCNDNGLKPVFMEKLAHEAAGQEPSFCVALSCTLDESARPEAVASTHQAGIKLIQWNNPAGKLKSLSKILWDVSKAGIWNHVVMPAEAETTTEKELIHFMASNPNIVHSWIYRRPTASLFSGPDERPEISTAYTQVAALPGRPLWHSLNDPVHLLLYLHRYGAKKILRWRVRDDGSSVYSLGSNISYNFVIPQQLPPGYLDEICRLVEAGGSVDTTLVRYNLERAFLIGYALDEGIVVGNSILKRPRQEYVDAVNKQAGLDLGNYLERGYTSVRPEYRGMGIGASLLEGLTARVGDLKLFAIISADNVAAQKMALRNQTQQVASFYSKRLDKEVGVWIPEWMLKD